MTRYQRIVAACLVAVALSVALSAAIMTNRAYRLHCRINAAERVREQLRKERCAVAVGAVLGLREHYEDPEAFEVFERVTLREGCGPTASPEDFPALRDTLENGRQRHPNYKR